MPDVIQEAQRAVDALNAAMARVAPLLKEPTPPTPAEAEHALVVKLGELRSAGCDRDEAMKRLCADPETKRLQKIALGVAVDEGAVEVASMAEQRDAEEELGDRLAELSRSCANRDEVLGRLRADPKLQALARRAVGLGGGR